MENNWQGKRVLIIGAARQGLALARYLASHGAHVTLNDRRTSSELQAEMDTLKEVGVKWALGDHPLELLDQSDLMCLSGGIPLSLSIVNEAVKHRIPISNDTQIFLEAAPCKTVGITGSAGKTTTTSLVGSMAQMAFEGRPEKVWIGGNIGDPLIKYVDNMSPKDLAILEISSFQLEQMTISPNIAAVLNITPNHLDRHGTFECYKATKMRMIEFQTKQDISILGRDDPGSWNLRYMVKGHLISFGFRLPGGDDNGTFVKNNIVFLREKGVDIPLMTKDAIHLRGEHNYLNVLAACSIGHAIGLEPAIMNKAVDNFQGIAHRLEFIRKWHDVDWYNDSIATAPERTMAAIRSFNEPILLLLGGRDKNLPWEDLAVLIRKKVDDVILFGEAAGKIAKVLEQVEGRKHPYSVSHCTCLREAVQKAAITAKPGSVVLFSPGGTSFDEFRDFEERGESYRKWVQEL